jgi:prepilin-type N-terminal cleavage/methylation domain-containing protein
VNDRDDIAVSTRPRRRRSQARRRTSAAFTLVEVLTAIAVIAILASLLLLGINHVSARAKIDRTRTVLQNLRGMMTEFEVKGGRMRMVDAPYLNNNPWQTIDRETAPPGKMDEGKILNGAKLDEVVTLPMFARTRTVTQALLSMPANQTVLNNLPADVRMKDPPAAGTVTAPVLLDGWHNPILYAPRRAKPVPNPSSPPSGAPPADSTLKWGLQGLFVKSNPGQEHYYEPADGKGVFVSAGPDGDFSTADDNIYSDDSGTQVTDLKSKKP